jgi:SAM-dependent methyltransferase
VQTIQVVLSVLRDMRFDAVTGFETGSLDDLQRYKRLFPALQRATIYAPTRARPLRGLLEELKIPKDAQFVDLGCGKGRALIVAAQYGLRRLKGIDLVPDFVRTCETNLRKLRTGTGPIDVQIVTADIRRYEVAPEDEVFYLYDPCAWDDVRVCLGNILRAWHANPRPVRVIYHDNLLAKSRIVADVTGFDSLDAYCLDGNWFYVFSKGL